MHRFVSKVEFAPLGAQGRRCGRCGERVPAWGLQVCARKGFEALNMHLCLLVVPLQTRGCCERKRELCLKSRVYFKLCNRCKFGREKTKQNSHTNPNQNKQTPKPCSWLTRLVKAWLIFDLFLSGLEVKWMPSRTISWANAAETEKAVGSCEKKIDRC